MKTAKQGSIVDLWYEGRLEDGTLFDTNVVDVAKAEKIFHPQRPYEPLHITLGEGMLIPGFENAIIGMKEGEMKTVTIPSEQGYGSPREDLVKTVEASFFKDQPVNVGDVIMVTIQGQNVPAMVAGKERENYKLDFNHPLAGKTLTFKITLVKVE
ncbi:FKBP-type peptidyl-prolyl cis-trans isomerase [Candidatus Woesearchaeota archaeon]|nr:FKBP-type peptidyl-prolyl cis-trans isomerase [Candidatus Woesearchaeota archaeon]